MAKRTLVALSLALALFTPAVHAETFGAVLTGTQEAPTPNNSTGYGNATVTLDAAHTAIRIVMNITGLTTPINNAHLHGESPRGASSSPVIPFNINTDIVNGKMDRTYAITKELGDAIAARPELFYLNVHSTQFPGGEVRGQLTPLDTVQVFAAELRGSNEVPPNPSTAVGSALVTLDNNNNITWEVNAAGLQSPTRGHIHVGVAGVNGSIRVPFTETAAGFTGGRLSGSAPVAADIAAAIRANPAGFYVNLHTTAIGGGEIRGQLMPVNEYDIAVAGKVQGANGENFVTDVRIFNPSFSARAAVLVEFFSSTNTAASATTSFAVDVAPRGTAVLNDIAGSTGLNITAGVGALRVTSAAPLAVSSVIYDDRRARNGGTIGQFVPAQTRASALRRGVLTQLANNAASRSNVGVFNPNQTAVDLRFELRDAAGAVVGVINRGVQPLSFQQLPLTAYFPGVTINNAALSLSFSASAPVHVYGSNVDNVSADQIYVSAVNDPGEP